MKTILFFIFLRPFKELDTLLTSIIRENQFFTHKHVAI